jgi:hypothetical protein
MSAAWDSSPALSPVPWGERSREAFNCVPGDQHSAPLVNSFGVCDGAEPVDHRGGGSRTRSERAKCGAARTDRGSARCCVAGWLLAVGRHPSGRADFAAFTPSAGWAGRHRARAIRSVRLARRAVQSSGSAGLAARRRGGLNAPRADRCALRCQRAGPARGPAAARPLRHHEVCRFTCSRIDADHHRRARHDHSDRRSRSTPSLA